MRQAKHDGSIVVCSQGCSDIPIFGGEYEAHEEAVQSQNLLDLRVPYVRKIPHVLGELRPRKGCGRLSRVCSVARLSWPGGRSNLDETSSSSMSWLRIQEETPSRV